MVIKIGEVLAERYVIQRHMRQGKRTQYWIARDTVLGRQVAVSNPKDKMLGDSSYLNRFEQESRILALMEHPHITPIYDYGTHGDIPYQILRYITEEDLLEWHKRQAQPIPVRTLLRLIQQIGSAVDYMHKAGIVHRAVRRTRIIVSAESQPYLSNFDVATNINQRNVKLESEVSHSATLSPEEFKGAAPSPLSDIYAFGLLVFRLLTNKDPKFDEFGLVDTLRAYRSELPIAAEIVVSRLLNPDPQLRYQGASSAVDDLYDAIYSGQSNIDGKIFISYASKDREYVQKLTDELKKIGVDIWIDSDIPTGTSWADGIQNALNDCDMMLLIVTDASMDSDYVTHEWSYFMGRGKPMYPFVLGREMPNKVHPRLEHFQFSFGTDDMLNNVARIVDVLAGGTPTKLGSSEI